MSFKFNPFTGNLDLQSSTATYLATQGSFTPASANFVVSSGLAITAGLWRIRVAIIADNGGGVSTTALRCHVANGTNTAIGVPELITDNDGLSSVRQWAVSSQRGGSGEIYFRKTISSATTYYIKALAYGANFLVATSYTLSAERIS